MYDLVPFVYYNMNMVSDIGQFQSVDFQCIREEPCDFRAIRCFKVAILCFRVDVADDHIYN